MKMIVPYTESDANILAKTIYGEARGEAKLGRIAVAWVVLNRALAKYRGTSVTAVCQAPKQFSCWNVGDPNREKLLTLTFADKVFDECLTIAHEVLSGVYPDPTEGSKHYKVTTLPWPTAWGEKQEPAVVIGNHAFYNKVA